nr:MAG TPA: hypothetical protein [Caudoviricetes sp.]
MSPMVNRLPMMTAFTRGIGGGNRLAGDRRR